MDTPGRKNPLKIRKRAFLKDVGDKLTSVQEEALEMLLDGVPKTQIADKLDVERHTITRWSQQPLFISEFNARNSDVLATTRQRRQRQSSHYADEVSELASDALDAVKDNPNDPFAASTAQRWLGEFRSWRSEERLDMGDGMTVKHQHSGGVVVGVVGHIDHHHTSTQLDLGAYLAKAVDDGVIDVDSVDMNDPQAAVLGMADQLLTDGSVLDLLAEETGEAGEEV